MLTNMNGGLSCLSLLMLLHTTNPFGANCANAAEKSPADRAFELRLDGKVDEAASLLTSTIKSNPRDAASRFELARVYFYNMELDRAVEEMEEVVELDPNRAPYHYLKGMAESYHAVRKAHDPKTHGEISALMNRSKSSFRRAVQLDPSHRDARLQLINLCMKVPEPNGGGRSEAEALAKQAEALDVIVGAQARCMVLGSDDKEQQREIWETLALQRPDDAEAHEGLGRAWLLVGDADKALEHFNKTLLIDSTRRILLLDLARHLFFAQQYDEAEKTAARYVDSQPVPMAPMRAYAIFMIAKIHKVQKHDERAEELLRQAKQIDPRFWQTVMHPPEALFTAP